MVFKTPQDIVDSFHEMTTSILHTIEIAKKTNALELSMVSELEKKVFFYDNRSFPSFSEYITALRDDTHTVKGYFYNTPSKITSQLQLKPQLRTILNAIKSTIPKVSKEYGGVLDHIKQRRAEFDISPSSVINMFHVLINYSRDTHMFDTIELIDGLWPELRQKIVIKSPEVADYLNGSKPQNNTRRNTPRPLPKNTPRPLPKNTPRPLPKNTPRNLPQNNAQKIYPFGATRRRRRV